LTVLYKSFQVPAPDRRHCRQGRKDGWLYSILYSTIDFAVEEQEKFLVFCHFEAISMFYQVLLQVPKYTTNAALLRKLCKYRTVRILLYHTKVC
jgi:hypothetical protein